MSDLGDFEIKFLKAVEKVLSSVPSNLSVEVCSIWRSTLMDCYNHLRDVGLLITLNSHESN